ncbi:MAG: endonuclease/exonuclease/phosphatase family protein [Akkermansiaceae bacterium]|nr:endonuclease/exonuclease/phosphatase family protein [Akkermansiaceae bacterium]
MSPLRRRLGWTLVTVSLFLHLFTIGCYSTQPDMFAAFTVMPIWLWGAIGLLMSAGAFYFMRAPLSLVLTGIWALTLLIGSDEARALGHIGKPAPQPGPAAPFQSRKVVRVLTINTGNFNFGDPTDEILAWDPDIVLLQQTNPAHTARIASRLYQGKGDFRTNMFNGVITRWKIRREDKNRVIRSQQMEVVTPDGSALQVVNIHLATAATDLRLWRRSAWREHSHNRKLRRQEMSVALQILGQTTDFPTVPTIFGGDFNAPATDVVHRQLSRDFIDAFSETGVGWGNTFHRRFPILRIDHIYSTRHLTPVRCRVVETRHSDHRFVVADFLMR